MTTPDNVTQKADSAYLNLPKRSEADARREREARELHSCGHYLCCTPRAICDCEREVNREIILSRGGAEVVELINHICAKPGALR